jgi:hypothetical protein
MAKARIVAKRRMTANRGAVRHWRFRDPRAKYSCGQCPAPAGTLSLKQLVFFLRPDLRRCD